MIKLGLVMVLLGLTACGSAPLPRAPQALEQAQTLDKEARRALRNGELLRAQYNFNKALVSYQALDDTARAATTMINLATVTHQLHDDNNALLWLDKILLEKAQDYPVEAQLTASFRKAVILTNLARWVEAESAMQIAEKWCQKKCEQRFSLQVLSARLALLQGQAQQALSLVQGLEQQAEAGKEEQNNAMRVMAGAEEKLLRLDEALKHFQAALEVDKAQGRSARIAEDLAGLSRVAKQLGRTEAAENYAQRAAVVNQSMRISGK